MKREPLLFTYLHSYSIQKFHVNRNFLRNFFPDQLKCIQNNEDRELLNFALTATAVKIESIDSC